MNRKSDYFPTFLKNKTGSIEKIPLKTGLSYAQKFINAKKMKISSVVKSITAEIKPVKNSSM
jgi:hypothetical protein